MTVVEAPVDELDAVEVDDDDDEVVGATSRCASSTQSLAELQVYPNGQQASPHFGRVAVSAVVMSEMPGFAVTFCSEMSHPTALIVEHELPEGQHSTVVLAARTTHEDEAPQQKLDGSPAWLHFVSPGFPQVEAR